MGDIFGRVRMYNLGFVVFTVATIFLALLPNLGRLGAIELIVARMVQGTGGAFLMANSAAILTDAFPPGERGLAMGLNMISGLVGSFLGLVLGGVLASINWHLVFWVNVPFGAAGTLWAYFKLKETGMRSPARIDWWGNFTFAAGLIMILMGITYSLMPYGTHSMAWSRPLVVGLLGGGVAVLAIFFWVETRVSQPLMDLRLFRIRAFASGNLAGFLASLSRGGLQFMLIIWLQGIWLPLHGYNFERTPLWAGIYMLPLTAGILVAGPISGRLTDRYGARPFATGGMIGAAPGLWAPHRSAGELQFSGFRAGAFPERAGLRPLHGPEHRGHHEQPSCPRARGGLGHPGHLHQHRHGPFHGRLLHAHDRGDLGKTAGGALQRPHRPRGAGAERQPDLPPSGGEQFVRRSPWLQPARHHDPPRGPCRSSGRDRRSHHRYDVLPAAHLSRLPPGAAGHLRARAGTVPDRRRCFLDAGDQIHARGRW